MNISETEKNYVLNDSAKDKFYLVELIRKQQKEGKLGEMPMLIVNGEPKYYYHRKENKPANINKKDIKNIEIMEAEKCTSLFGAACKFGLITVNTYGKQQILP